MFLWAAVVGVARAVLHQHGDRALHARHRRDRDRRLPAAVEARGARSSRSARSSPRCGRAGRPSAATVTTFAFGGGDPNVIAIVGLLVIGAALTASPVVYQTVEKLEFIKVGAVLRVPRRRAVRRRSARTAYEDTTQVVTSFGTFPSEIPLAILVGALAAAGAGGANNLVQSNWIRDKGFGMGRYVPRIVSPITGQEEAAPAGERLSFPQRRGEPEPLAGAGGSARTSSSSCRSRCIGDDHDHRLLAGRLLDGLPATRTCPDSSGFDFIALEASVLDGEVGDWFGTLFLAVGAVSLFAAALGHRRLRRAPGRRRHPRRLHARQRGAGPRAGSTSRSSGTMVAFGCAILLLGFDQPLVLLTISTVLGGAIMFVYTLPAAGHQPALPAGADPARRLPARDPVRVGAAARHDHGDRRHRPDRPAVLSDWRPRMGPPTLSL